MFYTIYKTTNLLNGKFYIGKHQTKNLDDGYFGSGKLLVRAIKKHGIENFVTEVIAVYKTEREMNLAEKILVVVDPEVSYNLCDGGHGGFSFINRSGKAVKTFNRQNAKGFSIQANGKKRLLYLSDPVWAEKQKQHLLLMQERRKLVKSTWHIGKKRSPEACAKMSAAARKRSNKKHCGDQGDKVGSDPTDVGSSPTTAAIYGVLTE